MGGARGRAGGSFCALAPPSVPLRKKDGT